ncbi:unnamed protein product [Candidula unifasciata]|uniref:Uncharacterized protein n=1 Tax=Candidula unifasciata TaxID=100452 RepID=A0A8S3YWL4_9EUPU|nr:unnamed protein product [Candidula unifasciata]
MPWKSGNFTIWSLVWLLILLFLGWPIACILAWLYILLMPFAVCISALKDIMDFLEKCIKLPKTCAEGIMNGKSPFD